MENDKGNYNFSMDDEWYSVIWNLICIKTMGHQTVNHQNYHKSPLIQQMQLYLYKTEATLAVTNAVEMFLLESMPRCTGSSPFDKNWPALAASRPGEVRGQCQRTSSRQRADAVGRDQQESAGTRQLHKGSQGYWLSPRGHEDQGWTEHPHANVLLLHPVFPSRCSHEQQTRAPQPPPTDTNNARKSTAFERSILF